MTLSIKKFTSWYMIIGVLSIINSLIWWFEIENFYFVVGLGMTQLVDGIFYGLYNNSGMMIALFIDIIISGLFILAAVLTNRGIKPLYYVALIIYVFDAILLLYFQDFMSVAFHALALFYLFKGIKVLRTPEEQPKEPIVEKEKQEVGS